MEEITKRESLLCIEHKIIRLLETDEWRVNGKLAHLLRKRKKIINRRFVFSPEMVNAIVDINEKLMELESMVLQRTLTLYHQFVGGGFQEPFTILAEVAHESLDDLVVENPITLYRQMRQALDSYMRPILYHYHSEHHQLITELKEIDLFRIEASVGYLDDMQQKPEWNSWEKVPQLMEVPFCKAWYVLNDETYYSLADIIYIRNFQIRSTESVRF
jgi:hypothetical protein